MDTKTVIIGTAGHIDHGKTTLVKALTGTDTDRLKEEKQRGITIELGFARLELPSGTSVGVVDVPGHERFVKNMVAGVTGVDIVALVIAADEGVMPQTSEHLEICQLLGIKKGLVVLTKTDMVEEDWLELVTEDIRESLKGTFLENAPVIPVSSVTGHGLNNLLKVMDRLVLEVPEKQGQGPFRLPVDRSFIMKGFGTVVTGTVISGSIEVGQEVVVYPEGIETRIRGIQIHGRESQRAVPGLRTALNLQGVTKEEIKRGAVVALPGSLKPSYLLDLELIYLSSAEKPIKHRTPVRFHVGTSEIIGRILMKNDELAPGNKAFVQIKLQEPVAVLPHDRYVIRSYSPIRTIGGGRILNPLPRKRKRARKDLWDELKLLAKGTPSEILQLHLEKAGYRGLSSRELALRTGIYGKTLQKELQALLSSRQVMRFGSDDRFTSFRVIQKLMQKTLDLLENYHREKPLLQGMSREELKSRLFPSLHAAGSWGLTSDAGQGMPKQRIFQKVLDILEKEGKIATDKETVRLSTHKVRLGDQEETIKKTLETIYLKAGLSPPAREEAVKKAVSSEELFEDGLEIFDLLVRQGKLVRLKDSLYFHPGTLEQIERDVIAFLKNNQEMTVSDFRKLTGGLSRKFMIPLLE
ncbi:MAG: selenocysteine-specific translation elongation factor, partial [Thermodesulfatator sp.]